MSPRSAKKETGGEGGSVLTAAAIAELTGGTVQGDASAIISSVASLDRAQSGQLSFCASPKYALLLADTEASVVLVSPDVANAATRARARVVVEKPQDSLVSLLPRLYRVPDREPGVHHSAVLGRGVTLGTDAVIGPYVQVGDGATIGDRVTLDAHSVVGAGVRLGDDTHLFPNTTVYSGSRVGKRVAIHAGAVIGSGGFGYVYRQGKHEKIPHVGRCIIDDDVEIGAGTTIDRGSIDDTVIGAGTKIDNLVHVAHNVHVEENAMIIACAEVSGAARVGRGSWIGPNACVIQKVTLGADSLIGIGAVVLRDVEAGAVVVGNPAKPLAKKT